MLKIPSGAPTELCDHDVAVAEEVDVEVDVRTGLKVDLVSLLRGGGAGVTYFSGNVQLRNMVRQDSDDLRHGGYLQRGPYDKN